MSERSEIIHLHRQAPPKPPEGEPCNGCGVCCALETCPVARVRFWQRRGPCPALIWADSEGCYRCGLLAAPGKFLPVPNFLEPMSRHWMSRWIAAGVGCDCSAEVETSPPA